MITPFGKFCRKIRIDHNEILKDMSTKLGVTLSYLSAVENGKRAIPEDWVGRITELYNLNEDERFLLQESVYETEGLIKFKTEEIGENNQQVLMALARKQSDISPNELKEILNIFDRK
ncbi:helix-turn-helix domain-containing protein [Exiguobacterium acetylicum]|uniref:helix-turn-helix domain-containing protein n=1 Tax=Exiguobacterium acetylicum TaxID=41170 RepID=UPI001EE158C2|nr:helix-turn-helix transcriptional regulator [Exiguobacterium acetylicum]UKS54911.1 helix-turn-helix domain-containing protein [Exiguobacterium acetylicum]